ncbi:MAG: hypothetical protein M1819_005337 [Sarea resinae]|nr:MAG: hypothetical protein M1819_005337 [Sarea resinae]
MANVRSRVQLPVGSAQWVANERVQALQFVDQDVEDFAFSARNELDWLNEHMTDIFTKNAINVVDVFKTPGKLRGKTPRTARKRNPLETRAPLTDIFSTNIQAKDSPAHATAFYKQVSQFQVAEDPGHSVNGRDVPTNGGNPAITGKENMDSGYHGMTGDEMDPINGLASQAEEIRSPGDGSSPVRAPIRKSSLSFATLPAREPLTTKKSFGPGVSRASHVDHNPMGMANRASHFESKQGGDIPGDRSEIPRAQVEEYHDVMDIDTEEKPAITLEEGGRDAKSTEDHNKTSTQRLHDRINMLGQSHAPRPTKSIPSLAAISQLNYPDLRAESEHPVSAIADADAQKSTAFHILDDDEEDWIPQMPVRAPLSTRPQLTKSFSAEVMEKISGKNSIGGLEHAHDSPSQTRTVTMGSPLRHHTLPEEADGHDEGPIAHVPVSPPSGVGAAGVTRKKADTVSHPALSSSSWDLNQVQDSTTPLGSPKRFVDNPLSASKNKMSSILKSAKNLFVASAGVSAEAKMETLSPHSMRLRSKAHSPAVDKIRSAKLPPANEDLYPKIDVDMDEAIPVQPQASESPKQSNVRRTRSSTAKEQQEKECEAKTQHEEESNVGPSEVKGKTAGSGHTTVANIDIPEARQAMLPPALPKGQSKSNQNQKGREVRRPTRPTKETAPKAKPVAIHIPTASQREFNNRKTNQTHPSNSALAATLQDTLGGPQSKPKQQNPANKASTASSYSATSSTTSKKGTSTIGRPKALIAAAKKKEQAEIEARRKADHKRDIEQKRAAQQEEEARKRQDQSKKREEELDKLEEQARKRDEEKAKKREEEALKKRVAEEEEYKKHAAERAAERNELRRQEELQRLPPGEKYDAARTQALRAKLQKAKERWGMLKPPEEKPRPQLPARAEPSNDLAHALQQEKTHAAPAQPRGELANGRPYSRMDSLLESNRIARMEHIQEFSRQVNQHVNQQMNQQPNYPPINPARPPKRAPLTESSDEAQHRPNDPRGGLPYQQNESKRRRTGQEEPEEDVPRAAGTSNVRKDGPNSIFSSGYTSSAPYQGGHTIPAFLQSNPLQTQTNQLQANPNGPQRKLPAHPMALAATSNAQIPFASSSSNQPSQNTANRNFSPGYQMGDAIDLPDINTDSEDDDSALDTSLPSWADSPALNETLARQQLMNPEEVFGPIAPLHMEEIFKNKDRHHRFRSRTSSANWSGQDRLTEDEIRKDMEGRERLQRNGGWTYDT